MKGLTDRQLQRFGDDGYLVVEDVLSESVLADIRAEYERILERACSDLAERGFLRPLRAATFSRRYIEAMEQLDDMYLLYQHLDISLPLLSDLPEDVTLNTGPAVFGLLTHPGLLDIAESVIGPEIFCNPVQHARLKPPQRSLAGAAADTNVAATDWHQDAAVIDPEGDETDMLTVWAAITDATVANGCLLVAPGTHRGERAPHCPGKVYPSDIYIPDPVLKGERIPVEMKAGDVLLLHKMTEHASLENQTDDIRWSFDLRYQPIGQPTGRSCFPGFVARSQTRPESALTDHRQWTELWRDAKQRILSGETAMHFSGRWNKNAHLPICA